MASSFWIIMLMFYITEKAETVDMKTIFDEMCCIVGCFLVGIFYFPLFFIGTNQRRE